jgi:predicted tellurium resistance membrane protein TerC
MSFLLCMGFMIGVPITMAGAAVISGLLARFPWLALVGAGLLGATIVLASGMVPGRVMRTKRAVQSWRSP